MSALERAKSLFVRAMKEEPVLKTIQEDALSRGQTPQAVSKRARSVFERAMGPVEEDPLLKTIQKDALSRLREIANIQMAVVPRASQLAAISDDVSESNRKVYDEIAAILNDEPMCFFKLPEGQRQYRGTTWNRSRPTIDR